MSPPQLPRRSLQHALRTALRETCFGCLLPFPSILYHIVFQIARGFVHFFKKIFEGCTCGGKSGNVYPRKILDRPAHIRCRERVTASGKQGPRSVATKRKRKKGVSPQPLCGDTPLGNRLFRHFRSGIRHGCLRPESRLPVLRRQQTLDVDLITARGGQRSDNRIPQQQPDQQSHIR